MIDGSVGGNNLNNIKESAISGMVQLRQRLADIEDNSLVVIMYQLTTGRSDTLWYEAKFLTEPPQMLLIGGAIIAFAIILMIQNILFAAMRVINLGLLFVLTPPAIATVAIDDGRIFKGWLKIVCANLVSILGIILTLKIFGLLYTGFKDSITENQGFGQGASLLNTFMLAMFGLAGVAAAKASGPLVGMIFGIEGGINTAQSLGVASQVMRGATRGFGVAGKFAGKALLGGKALKEMGWSKKPRGFGSSGGDNGGSSPLFRQRMRKGLGSALNSRVIKPITKLSAGKVGTNRSKFEWADYKKQIAQHKAQLAGNKFNAAKTKLQSTYGKGQPISKVNKLKSRVFKIAHKSSQATEKVNKFNEMKNKFTASEPSSDRNKGEKIRIMKNRIITNVFIWNKIKWITKNKLTEMESLKISNEILWFIN